MFNDEESIPNLESDNDNSRFSDFKIEYLKPDDLLIDLDPIHCS